MGCAKTADDEARPLLKKIEGYYAEGQYKTVLDSIEQLRVSYPHAIESRKRALELWQDASLKLAQRDVALTDSALQATTVQLSAARDLLTKNWLSVKRDSLQARYDAIVASTNYGQAKYRGTVSGSDEGMPTALRAQAPRLQPFLATDAPHHRH